MVEANSKKKQINVSFATNGGETKTITVPEGSTVRAVLRTAHVKMESGSQVRHNGKPVKLGGLLDKQGPVVKEGDRVTLTPKINGG